MKKTLKMILYLIIGAAVGLLVSITAQNIGGEIYTDRFYIWVSIIILGIIMILSNTKYYSEIKEK